MNAGRRVALAVLLAGGVPAAAGVLGAGPAAAAAAGGCGSGSPKLTVQGVGAVTATPDLLTLTLEVSATGAQVGQALSAETAAGSAVLAALASGGVAKRDLETTDLSLQPDYAQTGTAVTGYTADGTVVAKLRHLSAAGSLVDAAVAAGGDATRVDSLTFSFTRPYHLQDRARAMAVHQAVGHAAAMAKAAGDRLGAICSLRDETVTTATTPPPGYAYGSVTRAGPAVPVQAGTQQVTDRVSVVYSLAPPRRRR